MLKYFAVIYTVCILCMSVKMVLQNTPNPEHHSYKLKQKCRLIRSKIYNTSLDKCAQITEKSIWQGFKFTNCILQFALSSALYVEKL